MRSRNYGSVTGPLMARKSMEPPSFHLSLLRVFG